MRYLLPPRPLGLCNAWLWQQRQALVAQSAPAISSGEQPFPAIAVGLRSETESEPRAFAPPDRGSGDWMSAGRAVAACVLGSE